MPVTSPAQAGPHPPPAQAIQWPKVFDGIGALFVRCDNDPDVQAARIPGLTWCAVKANDVDASPLDERRAWAARMRARGVKVGTWGYCSGPPANDVFASFDPPSQPFVIYDVEREYKSDEIWTDPLGVEQHGNKEWAAALVRQHKMTHGDAVPAAVTSYGGYKTSIDFGAFATAGWPILAQGYDSFTCADRLSYLAVYPAAGIHCLSRSLDLEPGEAVYRPESIDG